MNIVIYETNLRYVSVIERKMQFFFFQKHIVYLCLKVTNAYSSNVVTTPGSSFVDQIARKYVSMR